MKIRVITIRTEYNYTVPNAATAQEAEERAWEIAYREMDKPEVLLVYINGRQVYKRQ